MLMRNTACVRTINILTTCRGRERPGYQLWLAGEGFEREQNQWEKEKEEGYLLEEGHSLKSVVERAEQAGLGKQDTGPTILIEFCRRDLSAPV